MTPTLITQSSKLKPIKPQNGKCFTLEELQTYVRGYIEVIYLKNDNIMILNEEGKFDTRLQKNEMATQMAMIDEAIYPGDCIVGDVIVCPRNMVK